MEEKQNQQTGAQTPRRRRAVRAVPMGTPRSPQAEVPGDSVKTAGEDIPAAVDLAAEAILPMTENEAHTVSIEEPIPAVGEVLNDALSDAKTTAQFEKEVIPAMPMIDHVVGFREEAEEKPSGSIREMFSDTDTFSAAETFSDHEPQPEHTARSVGVAVTALLIVTVLCVLMLLPFGRRTEAVMLYIDEAAVGYIADEDEAQAGYSAVLRDLQQDTGVPFHAALPYRCETAAVQGTAPLMSAEAIYDAMYAHATDGYVRAYRLVTDSTGEVAVAVSATNGTGDAIGVMTEAEILSAIEAASAICRERYAAGLPHGTQITVEPRFAWETAWMEEDAILGEGALMNAIVELQDTAYAMLSVTATLTETAAERIPYETTLVPNDESFDGIRTMISAGADGLAQVTYTAALDPVTGEVLSRTEESRVVVREPISAVSYEGLYPLPDGVSTGSYDWPLPPLPDDELPLDENGNPYMPENPLALKNTYVSSGYGERLLWGTYDFHLGLDIVAPAYTEIYAADGGVVVYAAYTSSYGYMTRIRHVDNVETVYAHQIKQVVKPGDVVAKGQLIGYVGSTGTSSGSHLHLEFRRDHVTVDPLEYIAIPEEIMILGEGY